MEALYFKYPVGTFVRGTSYLGKQVKGQVINQIKEDIYDFVIMMTDLGKAVKCESSTVSECRR